jgi:hypothetical protein
MTVLVTLSKREQDALTALGWKVFDHADSVDHVDRILPLSELFTSEAIGPQESFTLACAERSPPTQYLLAVGKVHATGSIPFVESDFTVASLPDRGDTNSPNTRAEHLGLLGSHLRIVVRELAPDGAGSR